MTPPLVVCRASSTIPCPHKAALPATGFRPVFRLEEKRAGSRSAPSVQGDPGNPVGQGSCRNQSGQLAFRSYAGRRFPSSLARSRSHRQTIGVPEATIRRPPQCGFHLVGNGKSVLALAENRRLRRWR